MLKFYEQEKKIYKKMLRKRPLLMAQKLYLLPYNI